MEEGTENRPAPNNSLLEPFESGKVYQDYLKLPTGKQQLLRLLMREFLEIVEPAKTKSGEPFSSPLAGRPEIFARRYRRGWKLELPVVKLAASESGLAGLDRYQHNIDQYGDNAIAHLILPTREMNTLMRNRISTISQLEEFISKQSDLTRLNAIGQKGAETILAALAVTQELKKQHEPKPQTE